MPVILDIGDDLKLEMITRDEWGARPRRGTRHHGFRSNYKAAVGHHTAGSFSTSLNESMALLRSVQSFHLDGRGWTDIAYNFAFDSKGNFFEGRGFQYQNGANTPENSTTMSLVYLGNTGVHPFTVEAARAANLFIQYLNTPIEACPGGCGLWGHRDVSPTLCPGKEMYAWIQNGAKAPTC